MKYCHNTTNFANASIFHKVQSKLGNVHKVFPCLKSSNLNFFNFPFRAKLSLRYCLHQIKLQQLEALQETIDFFEYSLDWKKWKSFMRLKRIISMC